MNLHNKIIKNLEETNTSYKLSGKNIVSGKIGVCCPYCANDNNFHMGIDPNSGIYNCWKDSSHKGHITKLLSKITGRSILEVVKSFQNTNYLNDQTEDRIKEFLEGKKEVKPKKVISLDLLDEFEDIKDNDRTGRFFDYLADRRGFKNDTYKLINKYDLYCDLRGDYKNRIVIPIYIDEVLITWTSRSITNSNLKYQDHPIDKSVVRIKNLIANYDKIKNGGEVLFITEGPLDWLKTDFYLPENFYSTCLFTKTIRMSQITMINKVASKFKEIRILLDPMKKDLNIYKQAIKIKEELSFLRNVSVQELNFGDKDPGDLSKKEVISLI